MSSASGMTEEIPSATASQNSKPVSEFLNLSGAITIFKIVDLKFKDKDFKERRSKIKTGIF
jgi:hypothetical protein